MTSQITCDYLKRPVYVYQHTVETKRAHTYLTAQKDTKYTTTPLFTCSFKETFTMDTTCIQLREESVVKYEDQGVSDTIQTAYMNGDKSEQLATPTVDHGLKDEERKDENRN